MQKFKFFLILIASLVNISFAREEMFIFKDKKINTLYSEINNSLNDFEIRVYKDVRGIVLTFYIEDILQEYSQLSEKTLKKIEKIEYFLAKFKNPVIIEVHTENFSSNVYSNLKKWEITTVVANEIEAILLRHGEVSRERIKSIGYGEFLPSKNTPYNGVKNTGRVDIIILCNISGE